MSDRDTPGTLANVFRKMAEGLIDFKKPKKNTAYLFVQSKTSSSPPLLLVGRSSEIVKLGSPSKLNGLLTGWKATWQAKTITVGRLERDDTNQHVFRVADDKAAETLNKELLRAAVRLKKALKTAEKEDQGALLFFSKHLKSAYAASEGSDLETAQKKHEALATDDDQELKDAFALEFSETELESIRVADAGAVIKTSGTNAQTLAKTWKAVYDESNLNLQAGKLQNAEKMLQTALDEAPDLVVGEFGKALVELFSPLASIESASKPGETISKEAALTLVSSLLNQWAENLDEMEDIEVKMARIRTEAELSDSDLAEALTALGVAQEALQEATTKLEQGKIDQRAFDEVKKTYDEAVDTHTEALSAVTTPATLEKQLERESKQVDQLHQQNEAISAKLGVQLLLIKQATLKDQG